MTIRFGGEASRPKAGRSSGHLLGPVLSDWHQVAPGLRIRVCLSRKNAR